jgi:hypothetical protein
MALNTTEKDPCSTFLNTTGYPTLFNVTGSFAPVYLTLGTNGNLNTYLTTLNAVTDKNKKILATPNANSAYRLIKFLSITASQGSPDYSVLANVALNTNGVYRGIVDSYIVPGPSTSPGYSGGIGKTKYTFPGDTGVVALTDAEILSIRDRLLRDGFLLNQAELYDETQLRGEAAVATGTESLVYLYRLQQSGSSLNAAQMSRLNALENKNLRFFGAFMAEYCFYRKRYTWFLEQYFIIYTQSATTTPATYSPLVDNDLITALFGDTTTYTGSLANKQMVHLSRITHHMACLNTRMTDMQKVLTKINEHYNVIYTLIHENINSTTLPGGNPALATTISALQLSAKTAKNYISDTDFAKEVMSYNSEKNRYSNILLGLYAFLNISALAAIFHLSRS